LQPFSLVAGLMPQLEKLDPLEHSSYQQTPEDVVVILEIVAPLLLPRSRETELLPTFEWPWVLLAPTLWHPTSFLGFCILAFRWGEVHSQF
jgi:hypothetical protein